MEPITFTSRLERRGMFALGVRLSLLNSVSLTAMAVGPVLVLAGTLAGGSTVRSFGASVSLLLVAVPAAAVLVSSYNAYRPTATELLEPVSWEFSEEGVRVRTDGSDTFAGWDEFAGWRRAGAFYLLHTSRRMYVVLPAAAVPDVRRGDFEALLSAKTRRLR